MIVSPSCSSNVAGDILIVAGGTFAWVSHIEPAARVEPELRLKSAFSFYRLGDSPAHYPLAKDLYTNNPTGWNHLSRTAQQQLMAKLRQAEQRFVAQGTKLFPKSNLLTVRELASPAPAKQAVAAATARRTKHLVLTSASTDPSPTDYGATAYGDVPLGIEQAQYTGYSGSDLWGWTPCVEDTDAPAPGTASTIEICGGWALGNANASQAAGMTQATVAVSGFAAAQAVQPVDVTYETNSDAASTVTVSGTVESVSMSLTTVGAAAACAPSELLYGTPPSGNLSDGSLPGTSTTDLSSCLGSFSASVADLNLAASIQDATHVVSTIDDAYSNLRTVISTSGDPAVLACAMFQTAGDFAGFITDLGGIGLPSCQTTQLPIWTGDLPAGQTLQFTVAPLTQAVINGLGVETASLYSFVNLRVTECDVGGSCSTSTATTSPTMTTSTSTIPATESPSVLRADEASAQTMMCGGAPSDWCGHVLETAWTPDGTGHGLYAVTLAAGAGGCALAISVFFFDEKHFLAATNSLPPHGRPVGVAPAGKGKFSVSYVLWLANPPPDTPGCTGSAPSWGSYVYAYNGVNMIVTSARPLPPGDSYQVVEVTNEISTDEAAVSAMWHDCRAFTFPPQCTFAVADTANGNGGTLFAVDLEATSGGSCWGSVIYFFDGEHLATSTQNLPLRTVQRNPELQAS